MVTVDYLYYYDKKTRKETSKKYRTPVSVVKARADAISLLKSEKVGTPPVPFAMTLVALCKNVKGDPVDGLIGQVKLGRASNKRYVFTCGRYWDDSKKKWFWLKDNGTVRNDVEDW